MHSFRATSRRESRAESIVIRSLPLVRLIYWREATQLASTRPLGSFCSKALSISTRLLVSGSFMEI